MNRRLCLIIIILVVVPVDLFASGVSHRSGIKGRSHIYAASQDTRSRMKMPARLPSGDMRSRMKMPARLPPGDMRSRMKMPARLPSDSRRPVKPVHPIYPGNKPCKPGYRPCRPVNWWPVGTTTVESKPQPIIIVNHPQTAAPPPPRPEPQKTWVPPVMSTRTEPGYWDYGVKKKWMGDHWRYEQDFEKPTWVPESEVQYVKQEGYWKIAD